MFSNMWSVSLAVGRENLTAQAITLPITHFSGGSESTEVCCKEGHENVCRPFPTYEITSNYLL